MSNHDHQRIGKPEPSSMSHTEVPFDMTTPPDYTALDVSVTAAPVMNAMDGSNERDIDLHHSEEKHIVTDWPPADGEKCTSNKEDDHDLQLTTTTPPEGVLVIERNASESLTQLDKDVAEKQAVATTSGSIHNTQSNTGTFLSQMEHDVLAKTKYNHDAADIRPGAVSVSSADVESLQSLENDLAAKSFASSGRNRPASRPDDLPVVRDKVERRTTDSANLPDISDKESLAALENDVTHKIAALSTYSSETPDFSTGRSALSQLEQDVSDKVGGAPRRGTVRPGAVAVSSLVALERDVAAKQSTSSVSTSRISPVDGAGTTVNALASLELDIAIKLAASDGRSAKLNQGRQQENVALERDLVRKSRLTVKPNLESDDVLTALERDVILKAEASTGTTRTIGEPGVVSVDGASSLSALEREVAAKSQSIQVDQTASISASRLYDSSNQSIHSKGNQTPRGGGLSLTSFENDISKTPDAVTESSKLDQAPSSRVANSLSQLERDTLSKSIPGKEDPRTDTTGVPGVIGLRQLEADVQAKQMGSTSEPVTHAAPPVVANASSLAARQNLARLENEIMLKTMVTTKQAPTSSSTAILSSMRSLESSIIGKASNHNEVHIDEGQEDKPESPQTDLQVDPLPAAIDESQNESQGDPEALNTEGIVAFVAENVVDATGVVIIASDEEEGKQRWKKQQTCFCLIGVFVVVIIIVITVSVLGSSGDNGNSASMPAVSPTRAPSSAPTSNSLASLIQVLLPVSGEDAFADRNSPQYLAAVWLADDDAYGNDSSGSQPKFWQRYSLVVLYYSLGGPFWRICGEGDETCSSDPSVNSWLSPTDECSWYGLTCQMDGLLEEFFFSAAAGTESSEADLTVLEGELPFEIILLTELVSFVADGFKVSGQISNKFSKCPNLQTLILSNNNITGAFPKSFGEDNPNLEIINLSNNQISGSLPTVVGRLSKLSYLQINENVLSGQISAESLSTLFGLRRLELQGNLFTGPFPKAGYGLPDLEILRIDNTGFEGTIGSDIMQMNNLRELDMSRSLMGGPIPAELYRLQNLTSLKLNEANFIGEVSDDVRFLNQTLEYLYLYNNNLSGPMPVDGFGALTNLQELQLYGTDLTGVIPADSDLCGLVFSSQVQYIRTACDLVTCECCAKCVPL